MPSFVKYLYPVYFLSNSGMIGNAYGHFNNALLGRQKLVTTQISPFAFRMAKLGAHQGAASAITNTSCLAMLFISCQNASRL